VKVNLWLGLRAWVWVLPLVLVVILMPALNKIKIITETRQKADQE